MKVSLLGSLAATAPLLEELSSYDIATDIFSGVSTIRLKRAYDERFVLWSLTGRVYTHREHTDVLVFKGADAMVRRTINACSSQRTSKGHSEHGVLLSGDDHPILSGHTGMDSLNWLASHASWAEPSIDEAMWTSPVTPLVISAGVKSFWLWMESDAAAFADLPVKYVRRKRVRQLTHRVSGPRSVFSFVTQPVEPLTVYDGIMYGPDTSVDRSKVITYFDTL